MRLSKLLFCSVLLSTNGFSQFSRPEGLDTDKKPAGNNYLFPVNPGRQGFLAGTMGELRSTHFHAGIDIRTNNMAGIPILSAKEGYISRAIVSAFGYGRVLYVSHPNGHTTVYGHLDRFKGVAADYIREEQYKKKSFEIDLSFPAGKFPVLAGDTIALSGNTGASQGPHLHFEIRDQDNEALNPLKFGFAEIRDSYAPTAQKIALKTLDLNSRINDRFGRFEFYMYKMGNSYVFSKPILAHGRIGVELLAYDKMEKSAFRFGINYIEMFADSQRVFSQTIEKINFEESRGILALVDYKTMKTSGNRFNKLYIDDGNRFDYHAGSMQSGEIQVGSKIVPVRIELRDEYGNKSQVRFKLMPNPVTAQVMTLPSMKVPIDFDILENTLIISSQLCPAMTSHTLNLFYKHENQEVEPSYGNKFRDVYLLDLRKALPDSVTTCAGTLRFNFKDEVPSGTEYKFYNDLADIQFQESSLYDTLFLNVSRIEKDSAEVFSIGSRMVPLFKPLEILLKPKGKYPDNGKTAVYRVGNGNSYIGGKWLNDRIHFSTRELGDFKILEDTIPPSITRISINGSSTRLRIRDGLSGISYFEANLNGEWLLMNYDYKSGILQSEKLDKKKNLKGDFQLKVVDQSGNERIFKQKIL